MKIASGPLYYGSNGYEIKDNWNYSSYNSVYGKNVGSTYFNFIEMGQLFEKSGFTSSDGDIENALDPLDGWRLPTIDEWYNIVYSEYGRIGSTVNNTQGVCYALIDFENDDEKGLLLFPDGETITGTTLVNTDTTYGGNTLTVSQFNEYINQGCLYLPASGRYDTSNWDDNESWGMYWSSTENSTSSTSAESLWFADEYLRSVSESKSNQYYQVLLVKDTTYGEETPLEGANKDLNNWVI